MVNVAPVSIKQVAGKLLILASINKPDPNLLVFVTVCLPNLVCSEFESYEVSGNYSGGDHFHHIQNI
jgi:hypothetical protein